MCMYEISPLPGPGQARARAGAAGGGYLFSHFAYVRNAPSSPPSPPCGVMLFCVTVLGFCPLSLHWNLDFLFIFAVLLQVFA